MHPRNRYFKNPADFGVLAEFRPSLKPYLIKKERRKKPGTHTDSETDAPPTDTDAPPTETPPTVPCDDSNTCDDTNTAPTGTPTTPKAPSTAVTPPTNAPPTEPSNTSVHTAKMGRFAYTLDFSNLDGLRELTCAILAKDFNLHVEIPAGTLIPTVPQKLNYIHWVEDLLSCVNVVGDGEGEEVAGDGEGEEVAGDGEGVAGDGGVVAGCGGVAGDGGGVARRGGGVARNEQIPRGKDVIGIDVGMLWV